MLTDFKRVKKLVVILLTLNNSGVLSTRLSKFYLHTLIFMITCKILFTQSFVKIYSYLYAPMSSCVSYLPKFIFICTQDWYSLCQKNCDMNNFLAESWVLNVLLVLIFYHHNNITAKSWVLMNISDKTSWNTKTRACSRLELVCLRPHGSVAERINHRAFKQIFK